jgi:hypothetical protein
LPLELVLDVSSASPQIANAPKIRKYLINALTGLVGTRSNMRGYPDQGLCRHVADQFKLTG